MLLLAALVVSQAGLTPDRKPIECIYGDASLDYQTRKHRILIVSGLDGSPDAAKQVRDQVDWFDQSREAAGARRNYAVAAIPLANPALAALRFPPTGEAYANETESHVLWRWIRVFAPDSVLILGPDPANLAGSLPALGVAVTSGEFRELVAQRPGPASPARREMQARLARKPVDVARQLAEHYGHDLPEAVYIPAVALMARLRLGAVADVTRIVNPYASGTKDSLEKATSSHLSGHLVFADLARRTGDARYTRLVKAAADMGFDASGQMKESMPLHNEMSDSVFMGCPILAAAGRLTGEQKYFDMCLRHMRFMQKLDLRADGLYRHSPLDEAAWGRGNAFPALGLSLSLTDLPRSHSGHSEMLAAFRRHMEALVPHQEPTGTWRQVIDLPGSYRELSATAMIGFAMERGIRKGWLDRARYRQVVDKAWNAVKLRAGADGELIDVCTGTGKQNTLDDYLKRVAILGKDPRGGAMVMLFATEMAGLD